MAFFCNVLIGGQRARRGSIGECDVRTTEDGVPAGVYVYTPGSPPAHAPRRGALSRRLATTRGNTLLAPSPGSGIYPFAGGPTHKPPRCAHKGAVLQAGRSPHSAALRGVWEWLAHGLRRYGLRHDWLGRRLRWGRWLCGNGLSPDWSSFARRRLCGSGNSGLLLPTWLRQAKRVLLTIRCEYRERGHHAHHRRPELALPPRPDAPRASARFPGLYAPGRFPGRGWPSFAGGAARERGDDAPVLPVGGPLLA
jgi:hypothetical protein